MLSYFGFQCFFPLLRDWHVIMASCQSPGPDIPDQWAALQSGQLLINKNHPVKGPGLPRLDKSL